MYVALKHIGGKYTPGEILPDNLPDDMLKWLLEAGAIREIAPASVKEPLKSQTTTGSALEQTEPENDAEDEPEDEAVDEPEDETGDEAEDEPEILTIDPMEAVIPVKSAEAPKMTGKTGGRRKTK